MVDSAASTFRLLRVREDGRRFVARIAFPLVPWERPAGSGGRGPCSPGLGSGTPLGSGSRHGRLCKKPRQPVPVPVPACPLTSFGFSPGALSPCRWLLPPPGSVPPSHTFPLPRWRAAKSAARELRCWNLRASETEHLRPAEDVSAGSPHWRRVGIARRVAGLPDVGICTFGVHISCPGSRRPSGFGMPDSTHRDMVTVGL